MSKAFEEYMLGIPGYRRSGFNRVLAQGMWDHQQRKIDVLIKERDGRKSMLTRIIKFLPKKETTQ